VLIAPHKAGLAVEPPNRSIAVDAINGLGIDLLKQPDLPTGNVLLSPYSIQTALAMTYAGADGETKTEMAKTLHYPPDEEQVHGSFLGLRRAMEEVARATKDQTETAEVDGRVTDPVILTTANRLYGERSYTFREPFLRLIREVYGSPLEPMNFRGAPEPAREAINQWVENQTQKRIPGLIPEGGVDALTRLVLVNAIYLKAPWADPFDARATTPHPFHTGRDKSKKVPTMVKKLKVGYEKRDGYTAISLPYLGGELSFLILLADESSDTRALSTRLTPATLATCAELPEIEAFLFLPKFELRPPVMPLSGQLQALGMRKSFDVNAADFSRIAPAQETARLSISQVFHQSYLKLDEHGTEAAAATAVSMMEFAAQRAPQAEIHVDRPFLFAIQHGASGACLFLGRVADPATLPHK
jgi:serpin B